MIASTSYQFGDFEEKSNVNINPFIFGAVILVSSFYIQASTELPIISAENNLNSIYSLNLTKINDEKIKKIDVHNNQKIGPESYSTLNLTEHDTIVLSKGAEVEVLNMEELRKLQESFNISSERNHELQLKVTEQLATLNTETGYMKSELEKLNNNQDALPTLIRDEFKKIQFEKSESNKINWFAPLITGIVIGAILLIGQYFLGMV